jgi:hypothetical protein
MDSSALILFLKLSENLNLRGGFLILFGIRDSIKSLMTLTYLDHIVEIVATEADAIEIGTQTKNPREFVTSLNGFHFFQLFILLSWKMAYIFLPALPSQLHPNFNDLVLFMAMMINF